WPNPIGADAAAHAMSRALPDSGVDEGVGHVGNEVGEDERTRDEQDCSLDDRIVALLDRIQKQSPEAGHVEDLLADDRAGKEVSEHDPRDRYDGCHRWAENMAQDYAAPGQSLCIGHAYVVFVK